MKLYGLLGKSLKHSFSKKYFSEKFEREGITDSAYELFELEQIAELKNLLNNHHTKLVGMNVTIPYKEEVIPFLSSLDESAQKVGAVNVIKVLNNGNLKGFNSDYYGFKESILTQFKMAFPNSDLSNERALILGTGGASKAVKAVLHDLDVDYALVSRDKSKAYYIYSDLTTNIIGDYHIIINTTPTGMYPEIDNCPELPYGALTSRHFLFDLVYNPEETLFMKNGKKMGAVCVNGLEMLVLQAEKAWEIWNLPD